MKYAYDCYSDIGGRNKNEDSFCAVNKGNCYLFAVSDGLGGHECGEVASGIAISVLRDGFECNAEQFVLSKAIIEANKLIIDRQRAAGLKMMATVSAVCISGNRTTIANIGDSRSYLFKGPSIVFQTVDHSASQMAVGIGEISVSQIRNHEDRNILTRALGIAETIKIDVTELKTDQFDRVLVCSDGFWECVLETEMCKAINISEHPDVWLNEMRKYHSHRVSGNNDNNTAVSAVRMETSE